MSSESVVVVLAVGIRVFIYEKKFDFLGSLESSESESSDEGSIISWASYNPSLFF